MGEEEENLEKIVDPRKMEEEDNIYEEPPEEEPEQEAEVYEEEPTDSSEPSEYWPLQENPEDLHDNSDFNCPPEVREQIERIKKLFHVDSLDEITKVTSLNAN